MSVCKAPNREGEESFHFKSIKGFSAEPSVRIKGRPEVLGGMGRGKPIPAAAKQHQGDVLTPLRVTGAALANILADQSKSNVPAGSTLAEHICEQLGRREAWAHPYDQKGLEIFAFIHLANYLSRAAKEAKLASSVTVLKKKNPNKQPKKRQAKPTETAGSLVRGTSHVCPVEQNALKGRAASHPTPSSLQKPQLSSHLLQQPQSQAGWGLGQGQQPLGTNKTDQKPQKWYGITNHLQDNFVIHTHEHKACSEAHKGLQRSWQKPCQLFNSIPMEEFTENKHHSFLSSRHAAQPLLDHNFAKESKAEEAWRKSLHVTAKEADGRDVFTFP
ncbi:hypothetical protein DV515_00009617 [Chloebia gouldiae]|uniref:Uncharacterized protein n=1 Tax=Chloebia gouldiae TaxID=44316 RepID=A0A3L8SBH0_CHLGU|nr:hypothetical protein DV515_00009617 [Chloebia gouldiae]